ncbi:hypothetical protein BLA29_011511, partial [Euroglyphus maynei]
MIGLGEKIDYEEIKRISHDYYRLSNKIIEHELISTAEEREFDSLKQTLNKLLLISNGLETIRNGIDKLKRKEATVYDNKLVRQEMENMKSAEIPNPDINKQLIEMERQFDSLSLNNESTSTFKSATNVQATTHNYEQPSTSANAEPRTMNEMHPGNQFNMQQPHGPV